MTTPDEEKLAIEGKAMSFLARRAYAVDELRRKLLQRDFDPQLVEEVLADYIGRGWLDDEEFAAHQAELLAAKGWGPSRIRSKLIDHGVARDIAAASVDALDVDWRALARARVLRRFGELREDRDRQRAFRHLTTRGFSSQIARQVVLDDL